jgi:hypothetical protein
MIDRLSPMRGPGESYSDGINLRGVASLKILQRLYGTPANQHS